MPESNTQSNRERNRSTEVSPLKYNFKWELKSVPQQVNPNDRSRLLLARRLKGISLKGVSLTGVYTPTVEIHLLRAIRAARTIKHAPSPITYRLVVSAQVPVLRDGDPHRHIYRRTVLETITEHLVYNERPRVEKLKNDIIYLNRVMRNRVQDARRALRAVQIVGVRTEPGYFARQFNRKKYAKVLEDKQPIDKRPHIAVEIECLSRLQHEDLAAIIVDSGVSQYITLKHDGSLRPTNPTTPYKYNAELVVCTPREEFDEVITKLAQAIAPHVVVNKTCGLHVHFDMRIFFPDDSYTHWNIAKATAAYKRLYMCQSILVGMQPSSRTDNQYCRRNRYSDFSEARGHDNRYHVINTQSLSRHNTLEVRVHSGTSDARKIITWVRLLEAIMQIPEDKLTQRAISSLNTFAKLGIPKELSDYARTRTALFAEPSSVDSENEGAPRNAEVTF